MPLIGLWMASRILGARGKGQGLAVLPAAGQGRRRGAGMPRLLSALHPRGASQHVTGPRPEAARVPAVLSFQGFVKVTGAVFGADGLWVVGLADRPLSEHR